MASRMERIGRYQVVGELGRGAMGIVYRAVDPAIGRTVAIKTIRLSEFIEPGERERMRERLFREAQSAGILSHPGIITIYDIAEEGDVAYIFMEFVNGSTLERLLASDAPPDRDAVLNVLRQTAAALDYAHQKGIVHRDIKPSNIMVQEDGRGKIADFGVAKIVSQQMTQAGQMMGTPNYMSPEQIQGAAVDGNADQFAVAVIAYEILTGEKPFAADTLAALLYKIVREEPAPVQHLNPSLDAQVDAVLRRGLAKDPAARYPTCNDFAQALETALSGCADWRLMPRGSLQSLPTVVEPTLAPPPLPPPPPPPVPPAPEPTAAQARKPQRYGDEPAPAPPSRPSQGAVVAVLITLLVAVVVLFGIRYFSSVVSRAPQVAESPTPAPSATAPAPEQTPKPLEAAKPSPASPAEAPPKEQPASPPQQTRAPVALPQQPILIRSSPVGAKVVFDGKPDSACTTPCSVPLPNGRHTMEATFAGYRPILRVFESPRESEFYLSMTRAGGTLLVRTIPPGASVRINGEVRPEKTPATIPLPVGHYKLVVSLAGYRDDDQDLDIKDGAMLEATFSLGK
jgi:serine/threonine protein kinase